MSVPTSPQDLINLIREKLFNNTSGIIDEPSLREVLENIVKVLDAKFSMFSPNLTEEQFAKWNLILDYMAKETKGVLSSSSPTPTEKGKYLLSSAGTYANIGGLVAAADKLNYAYFDGTNWSLIAADLPQPIVNNYTNNNTYNLDPEQIVPSEATYQDDTLAGDILKRVDKATGENVNYRETTTWHDGSAMTDVKADGVMFIKKSGKYYKREFEGFINVKWFGAKGDGETDDTIAFINLLAFLSKVNLNYKVFIPEGEFIIKEKLVVSGLNNLPIIQGAGMRNTILNFSESNDLFCIQIGEENKNSLGGGISDLQIKGNANIDGIYITAKAPYSITENTFDNIYIQNIKNGIVEDEEGVFYNAHFSNIKIEKYYGVGLIVRSYYNNYSGIFIVQASGAVSGVENNVGQYNMALDAGGGHNTYNSFQSEDQIKITSSFNTLNGLTIEVISKSEVNTGVGETGINVSGSNNIFNRLTLMGIPSSKYQYLMLFNGQNNVLIDATYIDWNEPRYKVSYPFYPSPESSGTMINCVPNTSIGLDHPSIANSAKNWSFINVKGGNNKIFSKISNEGYKLSTEDRNNLTPEEGTEIYNTTTKSKEYWNGSQWKTIQTN